MACIGTTGVWLTIVGTKLYQAFVTFAGPGCSGTYTMTLNGAPPAITVPGYVADVSSPAITGLPASTFIMRVTNIGSPTPTSDYVIVLIGTGGFYEMGPTSGNYSGGFQYANHTTWADWLANEAEVAGFMADPTGYVPGAGFIRLTTVPGSP